MSLAASNAGSSSNDDDATQVGGVLYRMYFQNIYDNAFVNNYKALINTSGNPRGLLELLLPGVSLFLMCLRLLLCILCSLFTSILLIGLQCSLDVLFCFRVLDCCLLGFVEEYARKC